MSERPSPKVDFAVVGAQKSGTTALRHFLKQHPQIGLHIPPGAHYFDRRIKQDRSAHYEGYHALFTDDDLAKVTGDVTPIYMFWNGVPELIKAYNPDMKLIVILRNPADRAYSQWVMQHEKGLVPESFGRAVFGEVCSLLARRGQHRLRSFVQRGFYHSQLRRLIALFGHERVLVLRTEDLRERHAQTMRRVFRFLGVEEGIRIEPDLVHSRSYLPLPSVWRVLLTAVFWWDLHRLQRLLGMDFSAWRCVDQRSRDRSATPGR